LVVKNFSSQETCKKYLEYFNDKNSGSDKEDKTISDSLKSLKEQIKLELSDFLKESNIYCSYFSFHKLLEGMRVSPHSDSQDIDGFDSSNDREFATLLYLNDDFEGGELYFPDHNIEYSPETGSLVIFSGGKKNLHGVRLILNKDRNSIIGFWGREGL
jgi:hypothetical protein